MRRARKKIFLALVATAIIALAAYFWRNAGKSNVLPPEFLAVRGETALVSQKIVDITRTTDEKIRAVNLFDFSGDPDKALAFIREARRSNGEAYDQAFELSRDLQRLAESLGEIKPTARQRLAYEAVAVELGLVSEFIVYTQYLNRFLDDLARAIATDSFKDRQVVADSLREVNQRVAQINQLNNEFLSKMEVFDKY